MRKALPSPAVQPEVMPPVTDDGEFLKQLYRLYESAQAVKFSDPVTALNCLQLISLLESRLHDRLSANRGCCR